MGRRFLPWFDADRLRKHVKSHGFMPGLDGAIATQTMHILQACSPTNLLHRLAAIDRNTVRSESRGASMKKDSAVALFQTRRRRGEPSCDLVTGRWPRALYFDECQCEK